MTPADLFNRAKIDAATDAAIADHAREPSEATKRMARILGMRWVYKPCWHYATPEQRRVAWEKTT